MKYEQNDDELRLQLKDQVQFLVNSSKSFDNGFEGAAKRLATTLRVLLHDKNKSISLLTQLNYKNLLFIDTASEYDPDNLISTMGLVAMEVGSNGAKYVALLDDLPPAKANKKVSFDNWWNKIVFADKNKSTMSRKDLILNVADKDGGAHVDPTLEQAYANLTRFNSLDWNFHINGEDKKFDSDPAFASIRQIAHEVILTLIDEVDFLEIVGEGYKINLTEAESNKYNHMG
ncbi:MAG: hypothetical protein PHC34_02325 [Candidatus Gastranaerophilales bacterium]|nr:hypothetical protein [Candidatus Gastranaerophilales bacterium]